MLFRQGSCELVSQQTFQLNLTESKPECELRQTKTCKSNSTDDFFLVKYEATCYIQMEFFFWPLGGSRKKLTQILSSYDEFNTNCCLCTHPADLDQH